MECGDCWWRQPVRSVGGLANVVIWGIFILTGRLHPISRACMQACVRQAIVAVQYWVVFSWVTNRCIRIECQKVEANGWSTCRLGWHPIHVNRYLTCTSRFFVTLGVS